MKASNGYHGAALTILSTCLTVRYSFVLQLLSGQLLRLLLLLMSHSGLIVKYVDSVYESEANTFRQTCGSRCLWCDEAVSSLFSRNTHIVLP